MNNDTNINWYPGHMEKTKRLIRKQYQNIDLVYELVDARIPMSSKIKNIYDVIKDKPKILIMTKSDLADIKYVEKWVKYYETMGTKVIVADLRKKEDIHKIIALTQEMMAGMQNKRNEKGLKNKDIKVLVVGIPNVGKSTLINALAGKKVASTGNKPGITKNITWLKTPHRITLLDTPGILWPKLDNKEVALNLASIFAIKLEVVDVGEVAVHILNKLNRYYPEKLQERYKIEPVMGDINVDEAYDIIAHNMGAIKNNEIDYERVSSRIINDIKDEYIRGVVFDNEI